MRIIMNKLFSWNKSINSHHNILYFLGMKFSFRKRININKEFEYLRTSIDTLIDPANIPPARGPLRIIQSLAVELLQSVDQLCRRHHLNYWLDSGTLLGAVRHHGFIPWDDDIDLMMLSEDYEKFKIIAVKEFANTDYCVDIMPHGWIKIVHRNFKPYNNDMERLEFLQQDTKKKLCISIDIFPAYYLKTGADCEMAKQDFRYEEPPMKLLKSDADLVEIGQHKQQVQAPYIATIPTNKIFVGAEQLSNKFTYFEYDDIFPLQEIIFEEHVFLCPHYPKKVLWTYYRNYWLCVKWSHDTCESFNELPLEEQRKLLAYKTLEEQRYAITHQLSLQN